MKITSRQSMDEDELFSCRSVCKDTVAPATSTQSLADILKADGTGSGCGDSHDVSRCTIAFSVSSRCIRSDIVSHKCLELVSIAAQLTCFCVGSPAAGEV